MSAPPGPSGGLLGLRNARRLREDILGFCSDLARDHGDSVHYSIAHIPIFQFTHPDHVHETLVARARSFNKTRRVKQVLGQWNGNGLVLNDGEPWIRQRRLVQPAFRPQQLKSHNDAIARRADRMLDAWTGTGKTEIDIATELGRFTLGVVAEGLFGADVERHTDRFIDEVAVLNDAAIREMSAPLVLPLWAPLPTKRRMRRAVEFLKGLVDDLIKERRRSTADHSDLLSMLLSAVDDEGDGGRMTDEQVRDESINLLLGGNETTATGLTWTAHLLSRAPEIQDRVHAEIVDVLGPNPPTFESRLPLTEMAFKEALRLYPPVYIITREAIEDTTINGYAIPRGANVQLVPYITQRDPRWFPDPGTFRPERFASEDAIPRGAYIPFGVGPRACIGKAFALQEGTLLLAKLLRRFRLRPLPGAPEVQMEAQISLHPKGGLRLAIDPR